MLYSACRGSVERHSLRRAGAFRYHSLRFTARQSDRAAEWVILDWGDYCFGPLRLISPIFCDFPHASGMINSLYSDMLQRGKTFNQKRPYLPIIF